MIERYAKKVLFDLRILAFTIAYNVFNQSKKQQHKHKLLNEESQFYEMFYQ